MSKSLVVRTVEEHGRLTFSDLCAAIRKDRADLSQEKTEQLINEAICNGSVVKSEPLGIEIVSLPTVTLKMNGPSWVVVQEGDAILVTKRWYELEPFRHDADVWECDGKTFTKLWSSKS